MKKISLLLTCLFISLINVSGQSYKQVQSEVCGGVLTDISELRHKLSQHRAASIFTSTQFVPATVRKGLNESLKFVVETDDPGIQSIKMQLDVNAYWWLTHEGSFQTELTLYDDGTHGDEIANDGTFTIDQLGFQLSYQVDENNFIGIEERPYDRLILRDVNFVIERSVGPTEIVEEDLGTTLRYIDPDLVPTRGIAQLADDVFATDYVVNIIKEASGQFPTYLPDYEAVAQRFYELYPDRLDYLAIATAYTNSSVSAAAMYTRLRNEIGGTGITAIDEAAPYGSAYRLKGLISIFYDNAWPGTFNHEILHEHAVASGLEDALDLGGNAGHWGMIEGESSGFVGLGFGSGVLLELEKIGDNLYQSPRSWDERFVPQSLLDEWYDGMGMPGEDYTYNQLEKYLMGLIPADQVDSLKTLTNWQRLGTRRDNDLKITYEEYSADGIRRMHINELIQSVGPRRPIHTESQKDFRLGMVVASASPLTEADMAYYDLAMREYEKATGSLADVGGPAFTFEESVDGLARMSTILRTKAAVSIDPLEAKASKTILSQNYPNPFQHETRIEFEIAEASQARVSVLDQLGRPIQVLSEAYFHAGNHHLLFSAEHLSPGIYFYQIETSAEKLVKKMIHF